MKDEAKQKAHPDGESEYARCRADARDGVSDEGCPGDTQVIESVLEVGGIPAAMRTSVCRRAEVLVEPGLDHLVVDDPAGGAVEADEVSVEPRPRDVHAHGVPGQLTHLNEGGQVHARLLIPGLDVVAPLHPETRALEVACLEHVLDDAVLLRAGIKVQVVHHLLRSSEATELAA